MIRLQVSCPPPPGASPRSGAIIVDLHDVQLGDGAPRKKLAARFASDPVAPANAVDGSALATIQLGRLLVASSPVGERLATAILSLGPLGSAADFADDVPGHAEFGPAMSQSSPLNPRITVTQSKSRTHHADPFASAANVLALTIDIPSIHADVSKKMADALQYWADDVAQLLERTFGPGSDSDTERADSRDASLIGSRYFAKSSSGSGSAVSTSHQRSGETVVKVAITEGWLLYALLYKSDVPYCKSFDNDSAASSQAKSRSRATI